MSMDIRAYRQDSSGDWIRQRFGRTCSDLRSIVLQLAEQSVSGDAYRITIDGRIVATMNPGRER